MGNVICKPCCVGEKPKKEGNGHRILQSVEDGNEAKLLTNDGNTKDKTSDTSKSPVRSEKKNGKPVDIDNITIDEKATPKQDQQDKTIKDEPGQKKNGRSKKKKKRYVESSSDTTSSSSSSDKDSHVEKKYKKKYKDGSITKVYSKTTYSAEMEQLFTHMFTEQSAKKLQTDLSSQSGHNNVDCGGSYIDLTKYNLVEDVKSRRILDSWTKSVGLIKSPRGTCSCFRVGSKYIMTALHAIKKLTKPEFRGVQENDSDWRLHLGSLRQPNIFVNFEYLNAGEHIEENKFLFSVDDNNTVPFFDEATDSIVLELERVVGRLLPPPFKTFGLPRFDKKFSLVHHSGGKPKQVEPVDKMVDIDSERTKADIRTLWNSSDRFLRNNGKDVNIHQCECPPYDILRNHDRLLFHCIGGKGASGCPGIQVLSDGKVVVVTMLLRGYPDWYYSEECADIIREWDKTYMVQQGVNFASVVSHMRDVKPDLFRDIFEVRPSRTVEAVQPED